MSLEEHRQQVHDVQDSVAAYIRDAHQLLQTERFASLPERGRQALEMAAQLATHLTSLYEDAKAFGQEIKAFTDPEGERLENVIGDILELADDTNSQPIEGLRLTMDQTAVSGLRYLGDMLGDYQDATIVYAERVRRLAGRTNKQGDYSGGLGRKTSHLTNQMGYTADSLDKSLATVNEVLDHHLEKPE